MPVAVIIGASSGIGFQLAKVLSARGYRLGLMARRERLLRELAAELPGGAAVEAVDVTELEAATRRMGALFERLGRVDLFVYCAGVGHVNPDLARAPELETVGVNVAGFVNAVNLAVRTFERQGFGHLVGISSVAAFRGAGSAPAYGASKAFMSHYLEALHCRLRRRAPSIVVTDVLPGFVDTAMAKGVTFWMAPPAEAARQIADAVAAKRRRVYVTRRWRLVAWGLRLLPVWLWARLQ